MADTWLSLKPKSAQSCIQLMLLTLFYLLYFSRLQGNFLLVYQINQFVRENSLLINLNDFIRLFKIFVHRESQLDMVTEFYFLVSIHPKMPLRTAISLNNYLSNKNKIKKWNMLENKGTLRPFHVYPKPS